MSKVMIVEDDNSLREIYSTALQAEGYDVVSAADGEEALATAVKEKPDLLILDVMMPKISGFDVLDIMRSTPETKNAKIMMMTALSQQSDKERGERLGADRYLVKSQVSVPDVIANVQELLNGEPRRDPDDAGPIVGPRTSPIEGPDLPVGSFDDGSTAATTEEPTPAPTDQPAPTPAPAPEPTTVDNATDNQATQTPPVTDDDELNNEIESLPDATLPQPTAAATEQVQPAPLQPSPETASAPSPEAAPAAPEAPQAAAPVEQTTTVNPSPDQSLAEIEEAAASEAAAQAFDEEVAQNVEAQKPQVPEMAAPPSATTQAATVDAPAEPTPAPSPEAAPAAQETTQSESATTPEPTQSEEPLADNGNLDLPDNIKQQIEAARAEAKSLAEPSAQESSEVADQVENFASETASDNTVPVTVLAPDSQPNAPVTPNPTTEPGVQPATDQATRSTSTKKIITPPDRASAPSLPPTGDETTNPLESSTGSDFATAATAPDTGMDNPSMPGDTVNPNQVNLTPPTEPAVTPPASLEPATEQTPSMPPQPAPEPAPAATPPSPSQPQTDNQPTTAPTAEPPASPADPNTVNPHDISL